MPAPFLTPGTRRYGDWVALFGVVALATFTRLYRLDFESLWMDEAITYARSRMPLAELIDNAVRRYHNPTYFLIVHYVLRLGDSEWVLRLPSALSGILKSLAVYGLGVAVLGGREGKWCGLLAATLVLLMPSQLYYDQEARMYAILGLFAAVAQAAQIFLLAQPKWAAESWRGRPHRGTLAWAAYAVSVTVTLYLHNTAVLFAVTVAVASALGLFSGTRRRGHLRHWTLSHLAIAVASLPWLPTLLSQSEQMKDRGWWAMEPDRVAVFSTLVDLFGFGVKNAWFALGVLALATFGATELRRDRTVLLALLVMILGGPLLLGLVTLYQPMFGLRLMLWSAVPFAVLLSTGFLSCRPNLIRVCAVALAIGLGLVHLERDYYAIRKKPDWFGAVTYLQEHARLNDAIWATSGTEARSLFYYLNRDHQRVTSLVIDLEHERIKKSLQASLSPATKAVWTICSRDKADARTIRIGLEALGRRTELRSFGPEITIERFELSRTATR